MTLLEELMPSLASATLATGMWHSCSAHIHIPAKHTYTLNKRNKSTQIKERLRVHELRIQMDEKGNGTGVNT